MPLATPALPYGLRDVKVTPIDDAGVRGTSVDLPNVQTLSFSEAEDFTELRGDDSLVAIRGQGPQVEWSLEAGGIPFEAYEVMAGGTITESGVSPDLVKTYQKLGTDSRPYFQIEGQVISDSGGDVHCVIYRAKADSSLEGEFADGEFFVVSAEGRALPDPDNGEALYDFVHNETAAAIA